MAAVSRQKDRGYFIDCPCCYDMPVRITHGNGYKFKEYGIHNGATGVLKGWQLSEADVKKFKDSEEQQIVLQELLE